MCREENYELGELVDSSVIYAFLVEFLDLARCVELLVGSVVVDEISECEAVYSFA